MICNLVAGGLGTGLFCLPAAMAGASVAGGTAVTVAVVGLNAATVMILVEAAEATNRFDLGSLVALLPGPVLPGRIGNALPGLGKSAQWLVNVVVVVAMLGTLMGYLIVIQDAISNLASVGSGAGARGPAARAPLAALATAVVAPLCFLPQRLLAWSSGVALMVNLYLLALLFCLLGHETSTGNLPRGVCLAGVGPGAVSMAAAVAQCIIIQMCVLPMYQQLRDRNPRKFRRTVCISFGLLAATFVLFGVAGYLVYGPHVNGNVLTNLPGGVAGGAARTGTILVVAAVYPLMVIPMVAPLESALAARGVAARGSRQAMCAAKAAILLASFLGAAGVSDLLVISVIDGAVCVGVFTALAPGLVGLMLPPRAGAAPGSSWRAAMVLLILCGCLFAVIGVAMPSNFTDALGRRCAWRLTAPDPRQGV